MADDVLAQLDDPDLEVRTAARMSLVARGEAAVPLLVAALEGSDVAGRREAAQALGQLRSVDAVPALLAAVAREPYAVSSWAARSLGEIGDPRARSVLLRLLDDEEMSSVGAQALAALGDPSAVAPLLTAAARLSDRFDYGAYLGRYWTSYALVRLGDRSPQTASTLRDVIDRDFGSDTQQTWGAFRDSAVDLLFEVVGAKEAGTFLEPFLKRERETLQLRYKIARHYWLDGDRSLRVRAIFERMSRHPLYPTLASEARDLLATEN